MKVYRVYRDPDLFNYLSTDTAYYAFMRQGATPAHASRQRRRGGWRHRAVGPGDELHLWRCTEPDFLNGKWDGPPEDPFLESSDDDSSKRRGKMAQVKFGNCLNPMGRSLRPYDILPVPDIRTRTSRSASPASWERECRRGDGTLARPSGRVSP